MSINGDFENLAETNGAIKFLNWQWVLTVKTRHESISRKGKQQNKTTSAQSVFQSNKDQIFKHMCTSFVNYMKCNILIWVSVVTLEIASRTRSRLHLGVQPGYQQEVIPGLSRVVVGSWDTAYVCGQPEGVVQVKQWRCHAVGPNWWPAGYRTCTRC